MLGFNEVTIPTGVATGEMKVGVRIKVSFLPGHKAIANPLERAVATKSVAGILIHPASLILVGTF